MRGDQQEFSYTLKNALIRSAIQTFKTETVMVVSVKKIWKCFTTNYLNYSFS